MFLNTPFALPVKNFSFFLNEKLSKQNSIVKIKHAWRFKKKTTQTTKLIFWTAAFVKMWNLKADWYFQNRRKMSGWRTSSVYLYSVLMLLRVLLLCFLEVWCLIWKSKGLKWGFTQSSLISFNKSIKCVIPKRELLNLEVSRIYIWLEVTVLDLRMNPECH